MEFDHLHSAETRSALRNHLSLLIFLFFLFKSIKMTAAVNVNLHCHLLNDTHVLRYLHSLTTSTYTHILTTKSQAAYIQATLWHLCWHTSQKMIFFTHANEDKLLKAKVFWDIIVNTAMAIPRASSYDSYWLEKSISQLTVLYQSRTVNLCSTVKFITLSVWLEPCLFSCVSTAVKPCCTGFFSMYRTGKSLV